MSSEKASSKKKGGHEREQELAERVNGFVCKSQTSKKDVIDQKGNTYSVKGGDFAQVFLYSKSRFLTNTEFKSFKLTPYFVMWFYEDCRKEAVKLLKEELQDGSLRKAFFSKALFNSNEVDCLALEDKGKFKIYKREDVLNKLFALDICISGGREDKILIKTEKNLGEIEYRKDKRCMKFRLILPELLKVLGEPHKTL